MRRTCADWGSCPVHLVEDGDDTGTEICARTWNADNVEVVEEGYAHRGGGMIGMGR